MDPSYTDEDVNKMESLIREAQAKIEEAARMVCSSHEPAAIEAWHSWNRLAGEVGETIHPLYQLRPVSLDNH